MDSPPSPKSELLDELLTPTLEAASPTHPLYSARANVLVAFFGGAYASIAFSFLNTRRTRRVAADSWIHALAFGIAVAASLVVGFVKAGGTHPLLPVDLTLAHEERLLMRVLGLASFGAVWLRQRAEYKAAEMVGDDAPSPWGAGIACAVAGTALHKLVVWVGEGYAP
jgi:hypothetical protein